MSRDDYDFQGQLKYEHLQFFFRRHWMRFLRPFFSFIPFGLLLFVLFFAAGQFVAVVDAHYLSAFYAFLTMLVAIFYINAFCLQIIHHFFDLVVVTDCRIVVVRKTAFIKNDSDAIDLTKIQDIGVQSHGVISNYMGYGNLIITLSTSSPPVVPDGIGVLWASTYLNLPFSKSKIVRFFQVLKTLALVFIKPNSCKKIIPARVSGSDLFVNVVNKSQMTGWRIFLLGAKEGVAEKAIEKLLIRYPKANFVGSYAGTPKKEDENDICSRINAVKPDVLFTAYGSPAQEFWIHKNLKKLDSVRVAVGVGGTFDFAAEQVKRAPALLQKFGLEWLWRLFLEPSRIRRIWNATFVFVRLICFEKLQDYKITKLQD